MDEGKGKHNRDRDDEEWVRPWVRPNTLPGTVTSATPLSATPPS
jgi:hypothetical protein